MCSASEKCKMSPDLPRAKHISYMNMDSRPLKESYNGAVSLLAMLHVFVLEVVGTRIRMNPQ